MKRLYLTVAGSAVAIACTLFFVFEVKRLMSGGHVELDGFLRLLPTALAAFMSAYLGFAYGWHHLLAAAGARSRPWTDIGIFTTTQFAKYLPGNVGHHVGRVALAAKMGLPAYTVVASMIAEIAIVASLMALFSLPLLGFWVRRLGIDVSWLAYAAAGIACMGLLALLALRSWRQHPALSGLAAAWKRFRGNGARAYAHLALATGLLVAGIVLSAISLALLDAGHGLLRPGAFAPVLGLFAAAWLLGFVTPGAPAGIGIREVVLTEGLAPMVGRDASIAIALVFRILSTGADLVAFLLGILILWLGNRHSRD
ncbi:MAG TPA: lysylphosphatidylglycerol synthase domain-containing protein [Luteimonas sp.]|nr:lysylphosphatidylglycerol synthase domain-containing protein [Luteimonas sp.]